MRLLLLLAWFLFIASATFWLPAHEGDLGGEEKFLVPVSAVIAGLAAIGVRGRAESAREALVSALPVLALLGAAAVWGHFSNEERAQYRGGAGLPLLRHRAVGVVGSAGPVVRARGADEVERPRGNRRLAPCCGIRLGALHSTHRLAGWEPRTVRPAAYIPAGWHP